MSAFSTLQQSGEQRAAWLTDRSPDCPIAFSELTINDLQEAPWTVRNKRVDLPPHYEYRLFQVGISLNTSLRR
jgi:DNA-binding HxlR family transcriptional regulator